MSTRSRAVMYCFLGLYFSMAIAQKAIKYQPEQMHADLEKFSNALVKIHPGTYIHQNPQEFERFLNFLKQQTSKPLEATEFYKVVLQLIANLHDGHTQAFTFGKLGNSINNQKRLPFQVYIKNERIFIVEDMSVQEITEGSEILAIDGHLSNEIVAEILKHYSSDGKSSNGMHHWLGGPYRSLNRLYPEIYGERPFHQLLYRDYLSKKIVKTNITPISKETYNSTKTKKYPSKRSVEEAFSFKVHKKEAYAYLKINRFIKNGFDEPENTFPDFYKKCFEEISNKNIQNLIVDLRDNGGGKASNAVYLLQYFIDKPISPAKEISTMGNDAYFLELTGDTLNLDTSFGLVPNGNGRFKVTRADQLRDLMRYDPIKAYPYSGKLVVLINGGTTSAAGIAAGLLKEHTNAILVGEETFGYAGISNGIRQITIKGEQTETAIFLPLLHATYVMEEDVQKRSVVPDYHISNAIQDVLNDTDAILEFAKIKLLTRN